MRTAFDLMEHHETVLALLEAGVHPGTVFSSYQEQVNSPVIGAMSPRLSYRSDVKRSLTSQQFTIVIDLYGAW